jgi:mRNA interferase RelE/StbE
MAAAKPFTLRFVPSALEEWRELDGSVKEPLRKLLKKRLVEPRVPSGRLSRDLQDCCKLKLRDAGYRLVYFVDDAQHAVIVLAVGRRENAAVYLAAAKRRTKV